MQRIDSIPAALLSGCKTLRYHRHMPRTITINRAPVLTLWAAVVTIALLGRAVPAVHTEAGLRAAVTAVETPVSMGAPGTFVRSPRRFTYGPGRSYFRLSADADPAECVRVLDALVAMRHVWIVSVDPSHDPRLIERVARDAAFCEEQTEDVFAEFVTAGDRVRVIGKSMTEPPPDACFITGPLSDSPEAEIRHHYHRQLLRVGLPSVIPSDRLA